jgi:hypothetical protein
MSPPGLMATYETSGGDTSAETLELSHGVRQFELDRSAP